MRPHSAQLSPAGPLLSSALEVACSLLVESCGLTLLCVPGTPSSSLIIPSLRSPKCPQALRAPQRESAPVGWALHTAPHAISRRVHPLDRRQVTPTLSSPKSLTGRSLGSLGIRLGCASRYSQSASRTGPASAPDWLIGHAGSGGSGAELETALVGPPRSWSDLTGLPQSARRSGRVIWVLQLLAPCPGSPPPWAVTSDRRTSDFTCRRKLDGRKSARMHGATKGTAAAKTAPGRVGGQCL